MVSHLYPKTESLFWSLNRLPSQRLPSRQFGTAAQDKRHDHSWYERRIPVMRLIHGFRKNTKSMVPQEPELSNIHLKSHHPWSSSSASLLTSRAEMHTRKKDFVRFASMLHAYSSPSWKLRDESHNSKNGLGIVRRCKFTAQPEMCSFLW